MVSRAGPIPDGADAVVQVEDTEQLAGAPDGSKRVRILVRPTQGQDIRNVVLLIGFIALLNAYPYLLYSLLLAFVRRFD